jgi:hypothetical protein
MCNLTQTVLCLKCKEATFVLTVHNIPNLFLTLSHTFFYSGKPFYQVSATSCKMAHKQHHLHCSNLKYGRLPVVQGMVQNVHYSFVYQISKYCFSCQMVFFQLSYLFLYQFYQAHRLLSTIPLFTLFSLSQIRFVVFGIPLVKTNIYSKFCP